MVTETYKRKPIHYWILLVLSIIAMLVAFPASSILSRVYYDNGGESKWIISWVAVVGWPLTVLILLPTYFVSKTFPTPMSLKLSVSYIILGFLSAADVCLCLCLPPCIHCLACGIIIPRILSTLWILSCEEQSECFNSKCHFCYNCCIDHHCLGLKFRQIS